jgi:N-methylhydantoinase A
MRLGIDIGGTFTDLVLADGNGLTRSWKVPSTPPDFATAIFNGLDVIAADLNTDRRGLLGELEVFAHGTTVTTNIVLTRTGERVAILTTYGFADLYELARQYRGNEQDPSKVRHPVPLVPYSDVAEVFERVDFRGREILPIDRDGLRYSIRDLLDRGIRSFAVCFLWSFRNPDHELLAREEILAACPDAFVALSHEACPQIGEYERLSTTVITAHAGPALGRYASSLEADLRAEGFDGVLLLMKSDGGLGSIDGAVRAAGQTIYSGPVAGVIGAKALSAELEEPDLITFDMGGTSTDVGLVHQGRVGMTSLQFIDRQALAAPMIDVTTVGAGGGSIASRGPDGSLRVGPQSTGADPGPACYGRGGGFATVTDANLVLGLIDPEFFLGGEMQLDRGAAEQALSDLADELGLSVQDAARGIFRIANSVMADAIRLRTVFAGLDPRRFTLVSFGGAGGLHAACVAEELGISRVIVPRLASVYSASGLITTDIVYTFNRTASYSVDQSGELNADELDELNRTFQNLDDDAESALDVLRVSRDARELVHELDISYRRQILDFDVAVADRRLDAQALETALREFDERYASIYGVGAAAPENGYDIKGLRVTGVGMLARPTPVPPDSRSRRPPAPTGMRAALPGPEAEQIEDVALYRGEDLEIGASLAGPAIVEYLDTTLLVPQRWTAAVDDRRNLVMRGS